MKLMSFFGAISAIFYIEIAKERLYQPQKHGEENCRSGQTALYYSLLGILKLYAIYTPYMTDYIFQEYYRQSKKRFRCIRLFGKLKRHRQSILNLANM